MAFVLSSENVVQYLQQKSILSTDRELASPIKPNEYRNFNLIVHATDTEYYLVKQERFDGKGNTSGCLKYEWIFQQLIDHFPQLSPIQDSIARIIHFDAENAILVVKYLPEYISLEQYYSSSNDYPPAIAGWLGANLAQIHRLTWQKTEYQDFLAQHANSRSAGETPNFMQELARIGPGIFANICPDGLEFFKLYQRFPSLHQAIVELHASYQAACLTHNDPKFSNYLIEDRDLTQNPQIKFIDWEFIEWGDPAQDLGILISKYLQLWLNSLFINSDTDLNLALSLATCPLEKIQPSLTAILQSYLTAFPEITSARPKFVQRVIQFAGLKLINRLQHNVEYHYSFNNGDICTLQVAKTLLCYPEQAAATIFGLQSQVSETV